MSKRRSVLALAVLLALTSFAAGNGLNLNGLGTRAQSMGGAFVGVADDFSAVFWNPAGAAGFKQPTFGFYAVDLIPKATYRFASAIPEVDAKTQVAHYLGFLGAYYRPVGRKVVLGLGVSTPSGLGTLWDGGDLVGLSEGTAFDWSSKVGVFSVQPVVAVKLNEWLSVGASLNVQYGNFNLKTPAGSVEVYGSNYHLGQYEENMNGWGFGATFGVLARPVEKLGLGLTVRTPSTISFKGAARVPFLAFYGLPDSSDLERRITWPLWIAGGVSFRPAARLLLTADLHWTQWSRVDRITTEYMEAFLAAAMDAAGFDARRLDWKDAAQVRLGAEYALDATTALRAGYYRDPAPGPLETLNILLPTHTFDALSVGIGKTLGDLQLDFGLEYLSGDARTAALGLPEAMPGDHGMRIVVPSVSVQYRF